MAIPRWTWPDDDPATAAALRDATAAFDALSDPTRAAILGALFDASGPLSYSALASAADVPDNGRLNYHLRRLDDLVDHSSAGYSLSARGRALVAGALDATEGTRGRENIRSPNR
ncbi:helix-turn-helix domain-containing protein [Halobacterium sp. NMX12-1]|uniref:Helix-turn-helix domain-containing protein n=1 Tax=Halobacterium sp. NMX12-1 TaxID=3166650 RepID=A0AAU8CFX5_9EURY